MIWVGTNQEKHQEIQQQIAAEPKIVHVAREPKPAPTRPEGPMILVETGGQQHNIE